MCDFSTSRLLCLAFFNMVAQIGNTNTLVRERQAGWAVYGDTAVGHSTMVEAWENWHNFYITPKNIIRVEIRGFATLRLGVFEKPEGN